MREDVIWSLNGALGDKILMYIITCAYVCVCICSLFGGGVCYLSPGCVVGIFPTIGTSVVLAQQHASVSGAARQPGTNTLPLSLPMCIWETCYTLTVSHLRKCVMSITKFLFKRMLYVDIPTNFWYVGPTVFLFSGLGKIIKVMTQRENGLFW